MHSNTFKWKSTERAKVEEVKETEVEETESTSGNRRSDAAIVERQEYIDELLQKNPTFSLPQILKDMEDNRAVDSPIATNKHLYKDLQALNYVWDRNAFVKKTYRNLMIEETLRQLLFDNIEEIILFRNENRDLEFDLTENMEYDEEDIFNYNFYFVTTHDYYYKFFKVDNLDKSQDMILEQTEDTLKITLVNDEKIILACELLKYLFQDDDFLVQTKDKDITIQTKRVEDSIDVCNFLLDVSTLKENITKIELSRSTRPSGYEPKPKEKTKE